MKLYVEFKNVESRESYIEKLNKKDFNPSLNDYGTLIIEADWILYIGDLKSIQIEKNQKEVLINLDDVDNIEIQK